MKSRHYSYLNLHLQPHELTVQLSLRMCVQHNQHRFICPDAIKLLRHICDGVFLSRNLLCCCLQGLKLENE